MFTELPNFPFSLASGPPPIYALKAVFAGFFPNPCQLVFNVRPRTASVRRRAALAWNAPTRLGGVRSFVSWEVLEGDPCSVHSLAPPVPVPGPLPHGPPPRPARPDRTPVALPPPAAGRAARRPSAPGRRRGRRPRFLERAPVRRRRVRPPGSAGA